MTDEELWRVDEVWEGDGKPGAGFGVPGTGLVVFVTEWSDNRRTMSKEEFELAVKIRDFLRGDK